LWTVVRATEIAAANDADDGGVCTVHITCLSIFFLYSIYSCLYFCAGLSYVVIALIVVGESEIEFTVSLFLHDQLLANFESDLDVFSNARHCVLVEISAWNISSQKNIYDLHTKCLLISNMLLVVVMMMIIMMTVLVIVTCN